MKERNEYEVITPEPDGQQEAEELASWAVRNSGIVEAIEKMTMPAMNPNLKLEGCNLGRGAGVSSSKPGEDTDVRTVDVSTWYLEPDLYLELRNFTGQFHTGSTYVIR